LNRGVAHEGLGQLDKALIDYVETIHLAPGLAVAHYDVGNVHRQMKRFDQAIAAYTEAIQHRVVTTFWWLFAGPPLLSLISPYGGSNGGACTSPQAAASKLLDIPGDLGC
jgi:tetratricopeptide (TPR) repeat protein